MIVRRPSLSESAPHSGPDHGSEQQRADDEALREGVEMEVLADKEEGSGDHPRIEPEEEPS
jgi:hypothetical protein